MPRSHKSWEKMWKGSNSPTSREERCQANKERGLAIKAAEKCKMCGENETAVLQFHHVHPEDKGFTIGGNNWCKSWKTLQTEIDKCVVVCANCHLLLHQGLIELPED